MTQFEHPVPAPSLSQSERDNAVRYRPGHAEGHVESHFLKANSPDGERALWLKHTLRVPAARPSEAVAEVWAVAFAERGRRKVARKRSFPLAQAHLSDAPFGIVTPCAALSQGRAHGTLGHGSATVSWDLRYACPETSFRPYPLARMYTGGFPRSKSVTPVPDTRMEGSFEVFGERWEIDGWRGAQGHNWGRSHAHAYAWVHANSWELDHGSEPLAGVWLEALSGKVRMGPSRLSVTSPFLSVAAVAIDGELVRFDGPRALASRRVRMDTRSYAFTLTHGDARLEAEFRAGSEQLAGLRYDDPDGSTLACLNSKLARGRMVLSYGGRTVRLRTKQAALELGTREPGHGIELLA